VDVEKWLKDSIRLSEDLIHFLDQFSWKHDFQGAGSAPLTEAEDVLDTLYYFQEAALVNSADVFRYVPFMIAHKAKLEAIGAKGCLAALEKLMPFYEEQQKLGTQREQDEYWVQTKSARESAERLAEDGNEFAELLLKYAHEHADEIGK
jgi:hypothetical protein